MPQIPLYIPVEVCATVGASPATPPGQCLSQVLIDLKDDGVSAPKDEVDALRQVVTDAKQNGIDLKVVVMPNSPPMDTPLRDIATEVGHVYPSSTVLVLSPGWAGTYSKSYDRAMLEAGQDVAKTAPNPVQGTKNFVSQLQTPIFPWTTMTIVLSIVVALAVVLTRVLQVRARRAAGPAETPDAVPPAAESSSRTSD